jgi:hypothetical protein
MFHIDDPAQMTPDERLREVAAVFARALLRLNKASPCLVRPTVGPLEISGEKERKFPEMPDK